MTSLPPNTIDQLENPVEIRENGFLENLVQKIREKLSEWFKSAKQEDVAEEIKPPVFEMTPENIVRLQKINMVTISEEDLRTIYSHLKIQRLENEIEKFLELEKNLALSLKEAKSKEKDLVRGLEQKKSKIITGYIVNFMNKTAGRRGIKNLYIKSNFKTIPKIETVQPMTIEVEKTPANVIPFPTKKPEKPEPPKKDGDGQPDRPKENQMA